MTVENTPCIKEHIMYLAPFIGIGATGGLIRAMNAKKFSWKSLFNLVITGAFAGMLAGLYLKHTGYSFETQCAFAGAIGATAPELLKAVQNWLIKKLGGEPKDLEDTNEETTDGVPTRRDSTDCDSCPNAAGADSADEDKGSGEGSKTGDTENTSNNGEGD